MVNYDKISIIIPSSHSHEDLFLTIQSLCKQILKPYEIIVVDSSILGNFYPTKCSVLCIENQILFKYKYCENSFPGKARNIGVSLAVCQLIAFIDVQTIPRVEWLSTTSILLNNDNALGVYGSTYFKANSSFEKLVRDGFYGVLARKTLPGSVYKLAAIQQAGYFIEWVRAGEDTEWMLRLDVLKIPIIKHTLPLIDYNGILGMNISKLLLKWQRNYFSSRFLPHFFPQKIFLWLFFYPILVTIAFNWNYLIADWRTDSPFYIGHVTKMVCISPLLVYFILRGIILPLKRGVSIIYILPIRFIFIALICLMSDSIKAIAFSFPKIFEKN
jgi:hypothetical protein